MKTYRNFFTAAFAYTMLHSPVASWRRLMAMIGILVFVMGAQAATVQHLNTQTATASGAGAGGTPSIASFNIPAGKNRVLFIWAGFERDHISPADATGGLGTNGNVAGTGLGDNYPEPRTGTPPATTTNNQLTARVVGPAATVNKQNALVIGGTPSGDTRFIRISTSPTGSPAGTAFFSLDNFHIVLFENEIKTLLGTAASGTVTITLPDASTPSNAGDEAFIVASVYQNVQQTVSSFVRNATATAQVTTGTPGNSSLAPAAYDAGQAPDEADDGKLVLGTSSSTDGFVLPTGHSALATVSITNAGGQYDTPNGNINNEPNGLTAGAYFRNGGATAAALYTLQMAGAAASLTYGATNASFLLESDNADTSDAPASYGDATHTISGIRLGAMVDADSASLNNSTATADDLDNVDDEAGVTIPAALLRGLTQTIPVSIQNAGGFLSAWIDWNADGDFNDAGEQIVNAQAVVVGTVNLDVSVPAGATLGQTFARFRVSTNNTANDNSNVPANTVQSGEVEDYAVTIANPSSNAELSALSTTAGLINFPAEPADYPVNVPNTTTTATVTAVKADANATLQVQVNGGGYTALASGVASSALSLNVGANPIVVKVTAQDGSTIKTYTITVTRAAAGPTVTSVNPVSVPTSGGTSVTITGTGFASGATVTFGGIASSSVVVNSATQITATTPPGTGVAKDVVVTVSGQPSSGGTGLFSYDAPTVAGVSPSSGSTAGGTSVTITGTNFGGSPTVSIGGAPASSVVVVNATTITCVTPAGTPGARDVVVTVDGQISTGGTGRYTYVAPAPEIVVYDGTTADTSLVDNALPALSFGSVNVGSSSTTRIFTIQNLGSATADLTGIAVSSTNASEFTFTAPLAATLAPGATTTFSVTFTPAGSGARMAVMQIASDDVDENPFDVVLQGIGNSVPTDITVTPSSIAENNAPSATVGTLAAVDADAGQTHLFTLAVGTGDTDNSSFTISGTALKITPSANYELKSSYSLRVQADDGNGGTFAKVLTVTITDVYEAPAPVFLGTADNTGGGSGSGVIDAPNATATGSLGRWESIRQGAVLSSNGQIAFRGFMEVGTGSPPVTVNDFQGIWRYDGTDTRLKARSGSTAPDTSGALFDMLPLNPSISPGGLIIFYGALRMGTGSPAVITSNNFGLWSELGGGAVRLLLREGTTVGSSTFRNAWAATASDANTVALNAKLATGTALIHIDASGGGAQLTVVAEEGQIAPGGGFWTALDGNSSDPRLSASGDLAFLGWERVGNAQIQGIYSRLNTTPVGTSGAVVQARVGETAPGTSGATFSAFERPTLFNGGMAFRGFLNQNGDNAAGNKGQGVWAGAFGALAPVVRTGDTNAQIPTIPAGSTVTSVWSPFSNALGSITMRVGLANGGETRAIVGSTGGTMRVIAKAGDAAPGLAGETFTNFDHPVIGDGDQVAFTASTNAGSYGIWKQAPAGGALSLIMKVGDTISSSQGDKVVSQISLPGSSTDDRKFESRCMDATGRLLIHATFADGSTSLLIGQ